METLDRYVTRFLLPLSTGVLVATGALYLAVPVLKPAPSPALPWTLGLLAVTGLLGGLVAAAVARWGYGWTWGLLVGAWVLGVWATAVVRDVPAVGIRQRLFLIGNVYLGTPGSFFASLIVLLAAALGGELRPGGRG